MFEALIFVAVLAAPFAILLLYFYHAPNPHALFNRNPSQGWSDADFPAVDFPIAVNSFLSTKKVEWAIIGLAKERHVRRIYAQKGGPEHIFIDQSLEDLIEFALINHIDSVTLIHNHPEITPPSISKADMISHNLWKQGFSSKNIRFSEYVCAFGIIRPIL